MPILAEYSLRFFLRCFLSDPLLPESQDTKTNQNHYHDNKPSEHVRVYPPFLLLKPCAEKCDLLLILLLQLPGEKASGSHVDCRKPPVAASGSLLSRR